MRTRAGIPQGSAVDQIHGVFEARVEDGLGCLLQGGARSPAGDSKPIECVAEASRVSPHLGERKLLRRQLGLIQQLRKLPTAGANRGFAAETDSACEESTPSRTGLFKLFLDGSKW